MVLGWWELPEDDQPPEHIYLHDDLLNEHFDRVKERYRSKQGGDKPGSDWEDVPQAPMDQNELTRGWR